MIVDKGDSCSHSEQLTLFGQQEVIHIFSPEVGALKL